MPEKIKHGQDGAIGVTVRNMQLQAAADLACVLVELGREKAATENHPRQAKIAHLLPECRVVHKRRTNQVKRACRAAPLGNVGRLPDTPAQIIENRTDRGDVRRRIDKQQIRFVIVISPGPADTRKNMQLAPDLFLAIDIGGIFAHRQGITRRHCKFSDKGGKAPLIQNSPLHIQSADGIGAVKYQQRNAGSHTSAHQLRQVGQIRIKARADILNIVNRNITLPQIRVHVRISVGSEITNRDTGFGIGFFPVIIKPTVLQIGEQSMFRRKNHPQKVSLCQHTVGWDSLFVDTGRGGQKRNSFPAQQIVRIRNSVDSAKHPFWFHSPSLQSFYGIIPFFWLLVNPPA